MKKKKKIKIEELVEQIVNIICFRLLKLRYSEKFQNDVIQFIKFGVVGVSNTFIGYLIYVICLKLLRVFNIFENCDYLIAQIVMFALSVLWSFFWNNKIVFTKTEGKKRNIVVTLAKTYLSYAFSNLLVSSILLYVLVHVLRLNEYIAPIFCLVVTVPLNFWLQKVWAFKEINSEDKKI